MSAAVAAAIYKLHEEILYDVFAWNAIMDNDPPSPIGSKDDALKYTTNALYYARCTSQVCKHWRNIYIGSPLLWSKIINVAFLGQKTNRWRNEVLQRTGVAPIHVRAQLFYNSDKKDDNAFSFLYILLRTQWSRIEKVQIAIDDSTGIHLRTICDYLQQETDSLLSFDLRLGPNSVPQRTYMNFLKNLFNGAAPSLQHFSAAEYRFAIDSPSLSGLRNLRMEYNKHSNVDTRPRPPYTIREVIQAIGQMPLLEHLTVNQALRRVYPSPATNQAHHQNMKSLNLTSDCSSCLAFLKSIDVPHPNWNLNLQVIPCAPPQGPHIEEVDIWSEMGTVLFKYLQLYFDTHVVSNLELCLSSHDIIFTHAAPPSSQLLGFAFNALDIPVNDWRQFLPLFLKTLASYRLEEVKTLEFGLTENVSSIPTVKPNLAKLLATLHSTETLRANVSSIRNLLSLHSLYTLVCVAFPTLKTLQIEYPDDLLLVHGFTVEQSVFAFLSWRTDEGLRQVNTLNLGSLAQWTDLVAGDAKVLERLKGSVTVAWYAPPSKRLQQYVCGSGNPSRLTFDWYEEVIPSLEEARVEDDDDESSEYNYSGAEMLYPYD